jgi:hypothetical protein
MASERPQTSREGSERGLRVLIRRSRKVLRSLSETLMREVHPVDSQTTEAAAAGHTPFTSQLHEAMTLTQNLHTRFAVLEQRFVVLSEKVELLAVRSDAPRRSEHEGTLRPPKLPQGLGEPDDPTFNTPAFNSRPFSAPVEARQQSGYGLRSSNDENLRKSRNDAAGPVLSGNIAGLSLASLFSLFEFERSSGSLTLQHGDRRLDLLLRGGRVIRCELDGVRTAATACVREAFAWSQSTFTFRRDPDQDEVEPPQSVNALMLDAMRFHDEELRTG